MEYNYEKIKEYLKELDILYKNMNQHTQQKRQINI